MYSKEHMKTVRTCLITVLIPAWDVGYEGCMAVKAYDSRFIAPSVWFAGLNTPQGVDLGGDGSSSYQCDTVQ